jgi:transcriptional regulator GlxA family with amidase domain
MTSAGVAVHAGAGLDALQHAELVIVGGSTPPLVARQAGALAALAAAHARGARVMSICTGAFVLAHAGLLAGRRATTHWSYCAQLAAEFPDTEVDSGVLYVDDGDVLTSAGNAAGIDLLLHVVRRDHGSEAANRVARRRVVAPWREGGQSQFVERPVPEGDGSGTAATRAWAVARLGDPLSLADLAGNARMSVRTFTRRFRDETGMSPGKWLTQQRVDHARHLLESTDLPIDQVAQRSGFRTGAALRQQMSAAVGVAPSVYRNTFRATG